MVCYNFDTSNLGDIGSGDVIFIVRRFGDDIVQELQRQGQIPDGVRIINGIRCVQMDKFLGIVSPSFRGGDDTGVTVAGRQVRKRTWAIQGI